MGSISDYLEDELMDHVFNASYTPASTIYLALCTADPTDAATGASMNEVANSNAYARKAITFGAAASRRVTQDATVTYDEATGSWGTVTHWTIVDSATYGAGNVLAHGSFAASKVVASGSTATVASGQTYIEFSAGEISDFLSNELLDHAFRNQSYTSPDTYIGLTTATVSDSDTGSGITEVSGGSYARVQVDVNGGSSPTWDLSSGGALDNGAAITFPAATASWGTVTSVVICDASTSGNLLFYDNDLTDQVVGSGDTVTFGVGNLDVSMT